MMATIILFVIIFGATGISLYMMCCLLVMVRIHRYVRQQHRSRRDFYVPINDNQQRDQYKPLEKQNINQIYENIITVTKNDNRNHNGSSGFFDKNPKKNKNLSQIDQLKENTKNFNKRINELVPNQEEDILSVDVVTLLYCTISGVLQGMKLRSEEIINYNNTFKNAKSFYLMRQDFKTKLKNFFIFPANIKADATLHMQCKSVMKTNNAKCEHNEALVIYLLAKKQSGKNENNSDIKNIEKHTKDLQQALKIKKLGTLPTKGVKSSKRYNRIVDKYNTRMDELQKYLIEEIGLPAITQEIPTTNLSTKI